MSTELWQAIAKVSIELHPDRINSLAKKISTIASAKEFSTVLQYSGPSAKAPLLIALEKVWKLNPSVTPLEVAAALAGASGTASILQNRETIEMVWTGPSSGIVPSRHTEQVLLEVIDTAKWRLFIVSFVAYDFTSIREALLNAVGRNVEIKVLLESSKLHGGKIDIDSIAAFRKLLPSARIYSWDRKSKPSDELNGAVHAKCAVADGSIAFVTSANLTRAAMESNMELGVLVRGGSLPMVLERHLECLEKESIITAI